MIDKSKLMKGAWHIARNAVKTFGGNVREYLSESLRQAWKILKMRLTTLGKWFEKGDALLHTTDPAYAGNRWAEHGFDRTYYSWGISDQILQEIGLEGKGDEIFYDHKEKIWAAKNLDARHAETLNKYLACT